MGSYGRPVNEANQLALNDTNFLHFEETFTNLILENNFPMFGLNAPVIIRVKDSTRGLHRNVSKLFSELKLVTDNLFIYAEAN